MEDIGMDLIDFKAIFTDFVFPVIFLNAAGKYFKEMSFLWMESQVQMVELVLKPKTILR